MMYTLKGIVFLWKTQKNLINVVFALNVFCSIALAQDQNSFTAPILDKKIVFSVIGQFQKECTHVYTIDQNVLDNLQDYYTKNKLNFSKPQLECYDTYMSQLRGVFVVYKQTCEEVTKPVMTQVDSDLSRIFVNIRTYLTSFRVTHKVLNSCLLRAEAKENEIVPLSDYAVGTKQVFKSIREMEMEAPFKEERVTFR